MPFETLTPEFCYMNYSDNQVYSIQDTVTITTDFLNSSYMWDNYSGEDKLATIPSFSGTKEHLVEFGRDRIVSVIKLLNMNFASFTVELREGASTWVEVINETGYTDNNLHYYDPPDPGYLLVTQDGDFILTTSGLVQTTSSKYNAMRLRITALQAGETSAKIGECYVGARAFKNSVGKVLDFQERQIDFRRNIMSSWSGKAFATRSLSTYGANILFRVTDFDEYSFLEDLTVRGGDYTFFPTGGDAGGELSPAFSKNDIYLVQSDSDWNATPWGMNADQRISISILETEYVNT